MVPRRLAAAQGAVLPGFCLFCPIFAGDWKLLSPHEADDVLDRLHGFGGERLGAGRTVRQNRIDIGGVVLSPAPLGGDRGKAGDPYVRLPTPVTLEMRLSALGSART